MFGEPFQLVTKWSQGLEAEKKKQLDERLYSVRYHLGLAFDASRECSTPLHSFQWFPIQEQKSVILWGLNPGLMIRSGDLAIRASASALDTGLQLTNHVLSLNVEGQKVVWGREPNEGPLRRKMRSIESNGKLVGALDSIFGSIGYELLRGYRNWVTHRGAPQIVVPQELNGPLPIPEEALKESEVNKRDWMIKTYLLSTIPSQIHIICWPVAPTVRAVWSAKIDKAESDIELPGIHIGKGAQNITIENMRNAVGDLSMDAEEYKAMNPISLEENSVSIAGEQLATYGAYDYVHAVSGVVRFAERALTGIWDAELTQLCTQLDR